MLLQSFVGRTDALATLENAWRQTLAGKPQVVVVEGGEGSGRRSLISQMIERTAADPGPARPLVLRLAFTEGEDGLKVLLRLYASLYIALHDDAELRQSIHNHLETHLADATEPRKQWLVAFREGMEKEKPDISAASFPVTIPRQSPYLALQELVATISAVHPLLLDLGDVDHVLSFGFWTFLTALLDRVRMQSLPVQVVMWGHGAAPDGQDTTPFAPRFAMLEHLDDGLSVVRIGLEPLSAEEVQAVLDGHYASHRFPPELALRLAALSGGVPGRLADLLELMEAQDLLLKADDDSWLFRGETPELEWDDLAPSLDTENTGLARQVLQVAALEGRMFTARVISEQLSVEKDTVDDMLDDLDELVEEVVFHEPLQSWLYRFKNPFLQRYFAAGLEESARRELARGLGELLERAYLGRSMEYAVKAARLWREAGDLRRSVSLTGLAASAERPDLLQMGAEIIKAFPQTVFAPAIYKGLHLTLLEKVGPTGPVEPLLQLVQDVEAWAEKRNDEELAPWLAYYRARLNQRGGDLKEALNWAQRAQKGFARQNNPVKEADSLNVVALIALAKGELGVANENAGRALKKTEFPPVKAQGLFIRGIVHKSKGELQPAINTLKEALDLSGQTGQLPLHLDSGINIAECLLMGGKPDEAAGLLKQLIEVARQTRNPTRERAALSLLAKSEATLKDVQQAIDHASQALKLSRDLKIRPFEAADLLDLGIFSLVRGQLDEAGVYLREAEKIARELKDPRLLKEIVFHAGMVSTGVKDYPRALKLYDEALALSKELGDARREANVLFNIGGIYLHKEEFARARTFLDQAAPLIEKNGSPEEKKALKKAQEQLEIKIN